MSIPGYVMDRDIDLVILGLDGVLIDSFKRWKVVLDDIFAMQTDYDVPEDYFIGMNMENVCNTLVEDYYIPYTKEELMELFKINYLKEFKKYPILEGANAFINHLHTYGIDMALCTNLSEPIMKKVFTSPTNNKYNGWYHDYFRIIKTYIGYEDNKATYSYISSELNKEFNRILVVDDRSAILSIGHLLGLKTCAIKSSRHDYNEDDLKRTNSIEINDLRELL